MDIEPKFTVKFLREVKEFLDELDEKPRDKIFYNIWKSHFYKDDELFKKISKEIWEFRATYNSLTFRLFAFWDKNQNRVVVATHGIIKKSNKTPKKEIEKAEKIRNEYFKSIEL